MPTSPRKFYKDSQVRIVVCLVYLFLTMSHIGAAWQKNHYHRLEEDLLTNYSPAVRPVLNVNTVTNVSINFLVLCVYEIEEMAQAMTQNSYMALTWFDEFLRWDPQEYGGVTTMEFSSRKVWLPFIEVLNTVAGSWILSIDDMSKVIVKANGYVTWFHQDVWTTVCHMDITYFPFDTQQCNFSASIWTSSKSQVEFVHIDPRLEDGFFVENSEWSLLSLKASIREAPYGDTSYSSFTVTFYLKRRRVFHTLTLIVPNVILALLASLVFLLPVDTGEKMSFIMGLLLATGVSITVLMEIMPRSSLNLSFLMIYITALSMTTALAVVASAFIIYCCSLDGPVGAKTTQLVKLMLKFVGKDKHFFKSRSEHVQRLEVHDCMETSQTYEDFVEYNDIGARDNLRDTKGDKHVSNRTAARKDNQEKISWVDVASTLNLLCFRISISVVVGMTIILIIVLLLGSS